MTKEIAIHNLYALKQRTRALSDHEALDLAIKVLTQQPSDNCISRAYIESIVEELENICINGDEQVLSKLADIKNASSVTPKTEWIPVSERLPEENEYIGDVCKYYLIQDEYGDMHVAHLSNVGWIPINSLKAIGDEVIAWMPLPEPYKPQKKECADCKHYGKLSLDCGRCDDNCSMFAPRESEE